MKHPEETGLDSNASFDSRQSFQCCMRKEDTNSKKMQEQLSRKKNHKSSKHTKEKRSNDSTNMASGKPEDTTFGGIWDESNGMIVFPELEEDPRLPISSCTYTREEYYRNKDDLDKLISDDDNGRSSTDDDINTFIKYYSKARRVMITHMSKDEWDPSSFYEDVEWMQDVMSTLMKFFDPQTPPPNWWSSRNRNEDKARFLRILIVLSNWKLLYHKSRVNSQPEANSVPAEFLKRDVRSTKMLLEMYCCSLKDHCSSNKMTIDNPMENLGFPATIKYTKRRTTESDEDSDGSGSAGVGETSKRRKAKQATTQKKRQGNSARKTHFALDNTFVNLCTKRSIDVNSNEYDDSLMTTQFHVSFSNIEPNSLGNGGGSGIPKQTTANFILRLDPTLCPKWNTSIVDMAATAFDKLHKELKEKPELAAKLNSERITREISVLEGGKTFNLIVVSKHTDFAAAAYGDGGVKIKTEANTKDGVSSNNNHSSTRFREDAEIRGTPPIPESQACDGNSNKRKRKQLPTTSNANKKTLRTKKPSYKCVGCSSVVTTFVICDVCEGKCHPSCRKLGNRNETCKKCYRKLGGVCELGKFCLSKGNKSLDQIQCRECNKMVHETTCGFTIPGMKEGMETHSCYQCLQMK